MISGGSLKGENTIDFERQNTIGKPMNSAPAQEENDVTPNLGSINLTHGECPCHCLAQTVWYLEHSNLCLIWDVEEVRSIGLPTEGHPPSSEFNAGIAMDRGKRDEISGVEGTDSGIDTRY